MGLPAIAVSLTDKKGDYFHTAARVTVEIIQHLSDHPLPADQILNINVPNMPYEQLKGIKVTRQGRRHRAESMIKTTDPFNRDIYWYGGIGEEQDAGPGTDFHAVTQGYCSVTPITVDMTAYQSLDDMKQWIEKL